MFKFIKKLFHKEQPECEYAHIIYVLQKIQEAGLKKQKEEAKKIKKVSKPKEIKVKQTKKKGK